MSNNYLQFNGIDQYVIVPSNDAFNVGLGDFSISFWIKSEGTAQYFIFSRFATENSLVIENMGLGTDKLRLRITGGFPNWYDLSFSTITYNINDSEWHHITFVKSGISSGEIYIDAGSVDSTLDVTGTVPSINNSNDAYIGASYIDPVVDHHFDGSLDDFRIYKGKALTQGEINAIYNAGIGTKITGTEDSISWGSNCDAGSGDTLFDAVGSVDGTLFNNTSDSMWFSGGLPINLENMPVVNIQGMPLSISTPDSGGDFNSPGVLNTSYVLNSLIEPEPDYPTSLNWGGVPLSLSLCYDPEISETDEIGYFYALDVIEISEEVDPDDGSFTAEYTTLSGNRLQISKINNRYYLDIIRIGTSSTPMSKVVLKGMPLGSGGINELVLNRTGFTMNDIDEDPNTGDIDIKQVNIGGVPLSAGRVGFKYYLIVRPVAVP